MIELWASRLNLDGLLELMPCCIKLIHTQVNVSFIVEYVGVARIDLQGGIEVIKGISLGPFIA